MLRNKISAFCVAFAAVAVVGALLPRPASAIMQICNTAYVDYQNDGGTGMAQGKSPLSCFDRKSNPTLTVTKTVSNPTPAIGDTVTYTITVRYPKVTDVAAVCGDDSSARTIVVSDVLPVEVTYAPNSITLSENGGAPAAIADANGWNLGTRTVTVGGAGALITNMNEGDGDAACTAANTRVIVFQGVVNAL